MIKSSVVSLLAAGFALASPHVARAQAEAEDDDQPAAETPAPAPPATGDAPGSAESAPLPEAPPPAAEPPLGVAPGLGPLQPYPDPAEDAQALRRQGEERPGLKQQDSDDQVFAKDWWSHARPILEWHGYFRVRAELFHHFALGRRDNPPEVFPRPADDHYTSTNNNSTFGPSICTPDEAGGGSDDPNDATVGCDNNTLAGANLRFRLAPELHISDNLRVLSQVDLLDNLVLGSTPGGYSNSPAAGGGYAVDPRGGYYPVGAFETTQVPPRSGVNSLGDSIEVKRAWAEYATPVGELRFGRMPSHWGLGILQNAGDGPDDDFQTTMDRILFVTGLKALDLYVAGAWDFPYEGAIGRGEVGGQPYDLAQLDDVDQYMLSVVRRKDPELEKLALSRGELVLNAGVYFLYRKQLLDVATGGTGCQDGDIGCSITDSAGQLQFVRRGYSSFTPDLWLQLLYKKFRFELEAVTVQGSLENTTSEAGTSDYSSAPGGEGWKISQWGLATEIEQLLAEDRLRLGFGFGWASGDPDVAGLKPDPNGFEQQLGDDTISTFRFNPAYRVDLILHRHLLTRVQGTYYFRPSVAYDFMHEPNGQRFGGDFAAIWTRASQFIQAPGHERDLGIELNASLYFQSKDGALNDQPGRMGGFFTKLQYGVLFPLGGFDYMIEETRALEEASPGSSDTSTAQTLRWYLGVLF